MSAGTKPTNDAVYLSSEYFPVAGIDLLRGRRLAGDAEARHRGLDAGAAVLDDRGEHLGDRLRDACGTASRRTCGVHSFTTLPRESVILRTRIGSTPCRRSRSRVIATASCTVVTLMP